MILSTRNRLSMRNNLWARNFRWAGMVFGMVVLLGSAQMAVADDLESEIDTLLSQALQQSSGPPAEEKLAQAERLLQENGNKLHKLSRAFLEVNLAQTRGRVWVAAYRRNPDQLQLRTDARALLLKTLETFGQVQTQAQLEAAALEQKLGAGVEKSARWRLACSYLSRIDFARAWTHYSLAFVVEGDPQRKNHLRQGIKEFGKFTEEGYRHHPVIAECFLGEALCLYELQQYFAVLQLLDRRTITAANAPEATFKRISFVRIKAARALSSEINAVWAAQDYFATFADEHSPDDMERQMALDWVGAVAALLDSPQTAPYHRSLELQLQRLTEMIYPLGNPWRGQLAGIMETTGIETPFACLVRARNQFAQQQYLPALEQAQKGLESLDRLGEEKLAPYLGEEQLAAELGFLKTASCWNLHYWRQAHQAARTFLARHAQHEKTADMCHYAIQAGYNALTDDDPLAPGEFLDFLENAQAHWPHHPDLQNANWYRARALLEAGEYSQAEEELAMIPAESEIYPQAVYTRIITAWQQAESELSTQAHRATDTAQADLTTAVSDTHLPAEAARGHLLRTAEYVQQFITDPHCQASYRDSGMFSENVRKVALATTEQLLGLSPPQYGAALELLDHLPQLNSPTQEARTQLQQALQIKAHAAAGNLTELSHEVSLLSKSRLTDNRAVEILVKTCALLESDVVQDDLPDTYPNIADTRQTDRTSTVHSATASLADQSLVTLYDLLGDHYTRRDRQGTLPEQIVFRSRMANAFVRLGQPERALRHYEWLCRQLPPSKAGDVMLRYALTCEQLERYDSALAQWQLLTQTLPAPSPAWYRAQYHLILCHHLTGQTEQARVLLAYFQLQHPEIDDDRWQQSFAALAEQLEPNGPAGPQPVPAGVGGTDRASGESGEKK